METTSEVATPVAQATVPNSVRVGQLPQQTTYTVVRGDTLWGIAARTLADGRRWDELAERNGIADPSLIHPGQTLEIPSNTPAVAAQGIEAPAPAVAPLAQAPVEAPAQAPTLAKAELGTPPAPAEEQAQAKEAPPKEGLWSRFQGAVQSAVENVKGWASRLFGGRKPAPSVEGPTVTPPVVVAPETTDGPIVAPPKVEEEAPAVETPTTPLESIEAPQETVAPEPPAPEPVQHTVFPGDNLWSIAQQYLGNGDRWREIADANGLANPSMLRVGQILIIPNAEQTGPAPTPGPGPERPAAPADPSGNGMGASDPISLDGLRGINHTMASIYNSKGAYLKEKATGLGISAAAAAAVLKCESGGEGFHRESGQMIIRFENHIFWDQWGKNNAATFRDHFQFSSGQRWTEHKFRASASDAWQSFHGVQSKEWTVLDLARSLDDTAALKSISMGAAQIMGFNYATLGYANVQEMFDSMTQSLPAQLDGMFAFIRENGTCMAGLRSGNYTQFARGYNGSGQADVYGALISEAAAAYARVTRGRAHA